MKTQEARAKLVATALTMTENTTISPSAYELQLLEKYVRGVLTIDEVIVLLEYPRLTIKE